MLAPEIVLILWFPIAVTLFRKCDARVAVLWNVLLGTFFLPVLRGQFFDIRVINKPRAIAFALLVGVALVAARRRFWLTKPSWLDVPIFVLCAVPLVSSLTNGLGWYDGLHSSALHVLNFGVFYWAGRTLFSGRRSWRLLQRGLIQIAVLYAPLCWYEMLSRSSLHVALYGYFQAVTHQSFRFGGYRPTVFLEHGLSLALLYGAATIAAWVPLLQSRKPWRSAPRLVAAALFLLGTLVAMRSTFALAVTVLALAVVLIGSWRAERWPAGAMLAIPLTYLYVRFFIWNGEEFGALIERFLGESRASSFFYRMHNELRILGHAGERPWFGWGGWGRAAVVIPRRASDPITVFDSLWIIMYGMYGRVGLLASYATLLMPPWWAWTRVPARFWARATSGPRIVLLMVAAIFATDCIFNARLNPVFFLVLGALAAGERPNSRVC